MRDCMKFLIVDCHINAYELINKTLLLRNDKITPAFRYPGVKV